MSVAGGNAAERPSPIASTPIAVLLIVAVAVATRIVAWWNPVAHVDDQFYLLVGEELLKGHWPYVDVWDRKPPGLFLIYAGIAWIGGGTILGFNLIATGFAIATAFLIRNMATRFASHTSATIVAFAYLLYLPLFGGQNGQAPVFYNLLIAGAASQMFAASDAGSLIEIRRRAVLTMLFCGLSMSIKQVTFVEGAFFGVAFLWLLHRCGDRPLKILPVGAVMIGTALAPTALALGFYALAGPSAVNEFVYANFVSIFQRESWSLTARMAGLAYFLLFLLPLLVLAIAAVRERSKGEQRNRADFILLNGWLLAALIGYLLVPAFFDHYVLPLLVPVCVSASTFFDRPTRWTFFVTIAVFALLHGSITDIPLNRNDGREYAKLAAVVDQARHEGCIYLADGPTRLYSSTGACRLTRYLFPDHLNIITEYHAVGIDTTAELRRIYAQRPAVIVSQDHSPHRYAPDNFALLQSTLKNDYRLIHRLPNNGKTRLRGVQVWQRKDLPPPTN